MAISNIEKYRKLSGLIGFKREKTAGSSPQNKERVLVLGVASPVQTDLQLPQGLKPSRSMESLVKKAVGGGVSTHFIQGLAYSYGSRAAVEGRTKFGNFGKAGKEFTRQLKQRSARPI